MPISQTTSNCAGKIRQRVSMILRRLTLAALIGVAGTASAFQVEDACFGIGDAFCFPGVPIHEEITRDALSQVFQVSPSRWITFGFSATTQIEAANRRTDSSDWLNPESHFDAEKLVDATSRLNRLAAAIKDKSFRREYAAARDLMGQALHAVQDFYSHSNFVDRNPVYSNTKLLPEIWSPGYIPSAGLFETTCDTDGLKQNLSGLTSGYFSVFQATPPPDKEPALFYAWNTGFFNLSKLDFYAGLLDLHPLLAAQARIEIAFWPPNKCVHGHKGRYSGGLHKDQPDRLLHVPAKMYATRASIDYVKYVLSRFEGNEEHLCGIATAPGDPPCKKSTATNWLNRASIENTIRGSIVPLSVQIKLLGSTGGFESGSGPHTVQFVSPSYRVVCTAKVVPVDATTGIANCSYRADIVGDEVIYAKYLGSQIYSESASKTVTVRTVDLGDFRFELVDQSAGALSCSRRIGSQGYSPTSLYGFWADFDQCQRYVTPMMRCVGSSCGVNRFFATEYRYTIRSTKAIIYSGSASTHCGADFSDLVRMERYGGYYFDTYIPGRPGWYALSNSYRPIYVESEYNQHITGFPVAFKRNFNNINAEAAIANHGGNLPSQCPVVSHSFDIFIKVFDTVTSKYVFDSYYTLDLPALNDPASPP